MKKNKSNKSSLDNIIDTDFHYSLEYDYNTVTHCEEEGCNEEGICRCSTMEDFLITKVNINSVAKEFCQLSDDVFTKYCIYRAVIACKLYEPELWNASISHGYYGEEIDYIKIDSPSEIKCMLSAILNAKTNKEKLFIVLEKEYGHILPELKEMKDFEITTVDASDIHAGVQEHYRRLEKEIVDQYKKYDLPIGVGIMKNGGIKLIDGYHRFAAKDGQKNVEIIVGVE